MMIPVSIKGIGKYLPEKVISNDDLSAILDTNDEWISSRTGIKERRVVSGNESASELAYKASLNALENAGLDKTELDMIIAATSAPDHLYPSLSCEVLGKLGLGSGIPAFDVTAACTGFVYALGIARSFVQTGQCKNILVIGADVHSRVLDWSDRATCVLFGDGAGAMVVSKSDDAINRVLSVKMHANGAKSSELKIPIAGKNCPLVEPREEEPQFLSMNGREIYKFAVNSVPASVLEALEDAGLTIADMDYLVPHQANVRILDAVSDRLGISRDIVFANMDKYGNTSAASIPIALTEALESGFVKTPANVVISGFGAGLTWGSAVIRLENTGKTNG